MLRDQINVNTYLNITITIILAFFGYIGLQYEKKFDFSREDIKENGRKIDQLISIVNNNKIEIVRVEEKQNHIESRVKNVETAFNVKKN